MSQYGKPAITLIFQTGTSSSEVYSKNISKSQIGKNIINKKGNVETFPG